MSSQAMGPKRPKVLFVNEREGATPTYVAYCSQPWEVVGHLEIGPSTIEAITQLPNNLATLVRACIEQGICRSIGVSNIDLAGDTSGVIYFRTLAGREDDIIPLLRTLVGQREADDPKRSEEFDNDDLMAELLNKLIFRRPRPGA